MMRNLKCIIVVFLGMISILNMKAQESHKNKNNKKFYVKPYGGFIGIQDMSLQLTGTDQTSTIKVENGFGFTAGISLGYNFTNNLTAETGWEYKSNSVTVIDSNVRSSGDYASNFIFVNGVYNFTTNGRFAPYLGVGASFIQEIDLDFGVRANTSFSDSGHVGFQGLAGLDVEVSEKWALNLEAKYVSFSDFTMTNEATNAKLNNLSYNPLIFNIGVKYQF